MLSQNTALWLRQKWIHSGLPKAFVSSAGILNLPITSLPVDNFHDRALWCKSTGINYNMHDWILCRYCATGWFWWISGLRAVTMWSSSSFTKRKKKLPHHCPDWSMYPPSLIHTWVEISRSWKGHNASQLDWWPTTHKIASAQKQTMLASAPSLTTLNVSLLKISWKTELQLDWNCNPNNSCRDHDLYAPSQWETMSQCNVVSHWLGANTKWSLQLS